LPKTEFNIVIVGSGNMAFAMGKLFSKKHKVVQVVSRNAQTGKKLAKQVNSTFTAQVKDIYTQADFYLLCVPDDQIAKMSKQIKQVKGVVVHHSGAQALSAIAHKQRAVIYPFVSVNPETKLNSEKTSIYFQTADRNITFMVEALFKGYKFWSHQLDDKSRLKLHLTGVLMNNFPNHLYLKATLQVHEIPGALGALSYLAIQAVENFIAGENREKQTGPARSNDKGTMKKHLELIKKDRELSKIYVSLSQSIYNTYHHE